MTTIDRVVSRIVLGTLAPTILMVTGWWGSFALTTDNGWIGTCTIGGLLAGIVLDFTVLRKRLDTLYDLPDLGLAAIAVFYSVMVYGFFMGFPVFNVLVGAGWGFALGRRHALRGSTAGPAGADVRSAAFGVAAIMFALCCATAWLAFNEPTIAAEVRGMLGLPFTPTMGMLWAVTLVGGLGLVTGGYLLTRATARWAERRGAVHA